MSWVRRLNIKMTVLSKLTYSFNTKISTKIPALVNLNNGMLFSHKEDLEVLIHAAMWMNLENIRLSERSLLPKASYNMIPFT